MEKSGARERPADLDQASCPSCATPMEKHHFERKPVGKLELDAAERRRGQVNPEAIVDGMLAAQTTRRRLDRIEGRRPAAWSGTSWGDGVDADAGVLDLVSDALDFFMSD